MSYLVAGMLSHILLVSSQNYLSAGLRFMEPCLFQMNNGFPYIAFCWGGGIQSKGEEINQYPFHWMLLYLHFELFLPWKMMKYFHHLCACVCVRHPVKPPTGLTLLTDGFKLWQTRVTELTLGWCVECLGYAHVCNTWQALRSRKQSMGTATKLIGMGN